MNLCALEGSDGHALDFGTYDVPGSVLACLLA